MPCPRCKAPLSYWSRPVIDCHASPDEYQAFLADELNLKSCPSCDLPISGSTPTVIISRHWVGIALENPDPIPAPLAMEFIETLTQDLGVLDKEPAKPILVVARSNELRRMISRTPSDRFCRISLAKLLMLNFAQYIEMFAALTDACLAGDQPELGYWILVEAVAMFNELYFHAEFFDLLVVSALAAGDRIAQDLIVPQTAREHLASMRSTLEPHRIPVPTPYSSTYLCFYEDGPHPEWSGGTPVYLWNTVVDLLSLEADGSLDVRQAVRHQIASLMQAVVQEDLTASEKAHILMLFEVMCSRAQNRLGQLPLDIQTTLRFCALSLEARWGEMNRTGRAELETAYRQLTGREFRLDSHL